MVASQAVDGLAEQRAAAEAAEVQMRAMRMTAQLKHRLNNNKLRLSWQRRLRRLPCHYRPQNSCAIPCSPRSTRVNPRSLLLLHAFLHECLTS